MDAMRSDIQSIEDLAIANRILFDQGVVDAFGHVSVRHPERHDRFLMARNLAPALVTPKDILEFNLEANVVANNTPRIYLERFIHAEIYRAHPQIAAVVHSHSPSIIPFTVTATPLQAICHISAFLSIDGPVPIFEIRNFGGLATDMLIRNRELGEALAKTLGNSPVVLMRGHGSTSVGTSLQQAVYRAVYTEVNARLQSDAMRLGTVTYLTREESRNASTTNDGQLNRVWEFWKSRL